MGQYAELAGLLIGLLAIVGGYYSIPSEFTIEITPHDTYDFCLLDNNITWDRPFEEPISGSLNIKHIEDDEYVAEIIEHITVNNKGIRPYKGKIHLTIDDPTGSNIELRNQSFSVKIHDSNTTEWVDTPPFPVDIIIQIRKNSTFKYGNNIITVKGVGQRNEEYKDYITLLMNESCSEGTGSKIIFGNKGLIITPGTITLS